MQWHYGGAGLLMLWGYEAMHTFLVLEAGDHGW